MQIKVCGMRDINNIKAAMNLDINYIGLIFHPASPRAIKAPASCYSSITGKTPLPHKVKTVGVFVNENPQTVAAYAKDFNLDCIQLHGDEDAAYIEDIKHEIIQEQHRDVTIIKAISLKETDDLAQCNEYEQHADILLFDTKCDSRGGSGMQFDWGMLERYEGNTPFLLSGGIGLEDTMKVKAFHHPLCMGVDVNSKFDISPGLKDITRLETFINSIKNH